MIPAGLLSLRIRNYALIEDLTIEFGPGLNVLTGETGAGKSIIIGALTFLLGDKPDADMIRSGADSAQVEGSFDIGPALADDCAALGIEQEKGDGRVQLMLRRRIESRPATSPRSPASASAPPPPGPHSTTGPLGRLTTSSSRAFANDSNLTTAALARLGDRLVDLHGQHQHQLLLKAEVHLEILDEYAGLAPDRARVGTFFLEHAGAVAALAALDKELAEHAARQGLTEFQHKELVAAAVRRGEAAELHRERELAATVERRFALTRSLEELLTEQEGSLSGLLAAAAKTLAELAALDPGIARHQAALAETAAVTDDLWRELVHYRESIEFSPERMEQLNARLFLIEKLERKYGREADELSELEAELCRELEDSETGETRRAELAERVTALGRQLDAAAGELSRKRKKARKELESQLEGELAELGLGRARLTISIAPSVPAVTPDGCDAVEFLFSANAGEELRPLRKVASGGELSRIMLGLKGALAKADPVPTMVFDEIDVGIGGKVAEAVGRRLARLSRSHQVICITHLPQIAKYADRHYLVAKTSRAGRTRTAIRPLADDERVNELARMTAGETITQAGLAHAREMLATATRSRSG